MVHSFDLVREFLGEPAGPGLVSAVNQLTQGQIDALAEIIVDVPRNQRLPQRPVTEIWPLVPMRASLFFDHLNHESPVEGYAPTGIQLSAATNPRLGGTGAFSAGIIRALLYSHGLVIEDPLAHAAEMHLDQGSELRGVTRHGLAAAVASLSEISELIDGDVVNLFYTGGDELGAAGVLGDAMRAAMEDETTAYSVDDAWNDFEFEFVSGLSTPLQELWREIRGGNRTPDIGLVKQAVDMGETDVAETFVDVVRILSPSSIVGNAIASTACTVAAIQALGGTHDLLCASPLMGRLLFLGAADPEQQMRVHELTRTEVPNIGALTNSDLVAIRQASEALATWRHDLAEALDYARRVRQPGVDASTVQAGVEEMLADAREELRKEARKSRIWGQQNLVSFIAGGLGGAGGTVIGGTSATVTAGAAAGVLAAFIQATGQRHRIPTFLDRHYVAFARPSAESGGQSKPSSA